MRKTRTRVAVLGGGFGGLYAASYLGQADLLDEEVDVTLISDTNHFTFTPLLAEVVGGSLAQQHVTFPYRVLAKRRGFNFLHARVEGFDSDASKIDTSAGRVDFDYAVIALGAQPRYFGNEEVKAKSMPLKTVADAGAIRNRVLASAEKALQASRPEERQRLLTFAVAGAGPAGIEAASEIWHLLSDVLPRYYDFPDTPRVVVVDGGDRILRGWDEDLAVEGLSILRDRGVEIRLQTRVEGYDGRCVRLKSEDGGDRLEAGTLIWSAGMTPNVEPLTDAGLSRKDTGHLEVDEYLRVKGAEHVYAIGDVATLVNPRTGRPYPPVAPIAINQGMRAAGNIENTIAERPLESYSAHHAGKIVSLGNGIALVDLLGLRVRGPLAWFLYRSTYLMKLVGAQSKARAAATLLLNRIFERDLSCVSAPDNA